MSKKLEGKVAVVTGGTSGIGLAAAKRFVAEGAYVFITGRRQPELDAAVTEIGKNVTGTEACYARLGEGASPRDYAYPCSLMIESFGQTGGVLINEKRKHEKAPEDVIMLFVGVSGFRFLGEVLPGDTMEHRVALEKDMTDFAILGGEILVRDRVIAEIDSIIVAYKPASMIATARRS